jgi:hypothetical protein
VGDGAIEVEDRLAWVELHRPPLGALDPDPRLERRAVDVLGPEEPGEVHRVKAGRRSRANAAPV